MLALAQHHGLPTRFMDWTTNPLVALYFATRNTEKDNDGKIMDSAVYVLIQQPYSYTVLKKQQEDTDLEDEEEEVEDTDSSEDPYSHYGVDSDTTDDVEEEEELIRELPKIKMKFKRYFITPFDINSNVIYEPPHVSQRIRTQDGVLLACFNPLSPLEEKDYLEIIVKAEAHEIIRKRLDLYGVFDKQLFPDLDGMAKWLKFHEFECQNGGEE